MTQNRTESGACVLKKRGSARLPDTVQPVIRSILVTFGLSPSSLQVPKNIPNALFLFLLATSRLLVFLHASSLYSSHVAVWRSGTRMGTLMDGMQKHGSGARGCPHPEACSCVCFNLDMTPLPQVLRTTVLKSATLSFSGTALSCRELTGHQNHGKPLLTRLKTKAKKLFSSFSAFCDPSFVRCWCLTAGITPVAVQERAPERYTRYSMMIISTAHWFL